MSIASEIQRLQTAKANIKTSIENKGVTVPSSATYSNYSSYIDQIPTGGLEDVWEGVNFIDYDGTTVEVWPSADVASKTALPSYPTHTGLTYVGWNWTLAALKSYIASYPDACIYVGPEVCPTDNNTHIFIRLNSGALSPYLNFQYKGTNTSIDWGDGNTTSLASASAWTLVSTQHTYTSPGDYEIIIKNATNLNTYMGAGGSSLLSAIQLTSSSSSFNNASIGYQSAIRGIWLANETRGTNIAYTLRQAKNLEFIATRELTNNANDFGQKAQITRYACFPKKGTNQAYQNYALRVVAIPYDGIPGTQWFYSCTSLTTVSLPTTTTSITSSMFNTCYGLRKVIIPEGPTTIETQAFQNCYSLTYLIIPSTLTAINGANNFSSCYSMQYIVFKPSTPPTVAASTCLSGLPTTCLICVPIDKYVNYIQGTYYPSSSSYTYIGWADGTYYASGATLPTSYTGWTGTLTWYNSIDDLKASRNAITTSTGKMMYCKNY